MYIFSDSCFLMRIPVTSHTYSCLTVCNVFLCLYYLFEHFFYIRLFPDLIFFSVTILFFVYLPTYYFFSYQDTFFFISASVYQPLFAIAVHFLSSYSFFVQRFYTLAFFFLSSMLIVRQYPCPTPVCCFLQVYLY